MHPATFSPAPWQVSLTDDTMVIDAAGREVCAADGDYNNPDEWPVMEANARLVAAAPELLEALERARGVLAMMTDLQSIKATSLEHAWTQAMAAEAHARAVIARAKGASHPAAA